MEVDFAQPLVLDPSVFPGIVGYATGEVGFHSAAFDDAVGDFFQLSTAADFRFILLAKDPGMEVWNDHGSAYMGINEMFYIGSAPFDTHPIWNITSGVAGRTYSLTLKLRDVNGDYSDSAAFTLSFTPLVPPQSLGIRRLDPQHVELLWPTNATGWELQSATLLAAANWSVVTNVPETAGTNFSIRITMADTQQFFRLRHP